MTTTTAPNEALEKMTNDPISVERFRAIYTAHYDDLWRYCLRRTRTPDEADDVMGDVFALAWRRFADVPDEPDTRPWLFGVARNHLRNTWRTSARRHDLHLRLVADASAGPLAEQEPHDDAMSPDVVVALGLLSEPDAEILRLAAWEEMSHREIAVVLTCTENAVAIRLHRARERFSQHLERQRRLGAHATNDTTSTTSTTSTEGDPR